MNILIKSTLTIIIGFLGIAASTVSLWADVVEWKKMIAKGEDLMRLGNAKDAENLFRKSMDLLKKNHSEDHPDYVFAFCKYNRCLITQGKVDIALKNLQSFSGLVEKLPHAAKCSILYLIMDLGFTYAREGNLSEAKRQLKIALKLIDECDDPANLMRMDILKWLMDISQMLGESEQIDYYDKMYQEL